MSAYKVPAYVLFNKLAEHTERVQSGARKAMNVLLAPLETEIAPTPYDVVYQEDRVKLKHYRTQEVTVRTPLLVVYALINRETMLDLQGGRSVVQTFLKEGLDVYMVDWGYPTRKDKYLTIEDHVDGYLNNVVDYIRRRHHLAKINLMGVCMGGTFCVMYSALYPEKIKNLITTVAPTNFDTDQGLLHIWMKNLDVDRMIEAFGNMPGDLMNLGFLLLNPARLIIDKYMGFLENLADKSFVENFVRMEKWIFDSPDVPGETFRQFVKCCYKENLLIRNRMELGGRLVDLHKITMPLLNIYARHDHLVPPASCELLTSRVGSQDKEDVCIDTGHIGIYVSSKSQGLFAPKIVSWLKEREKTARRPVTARVLESARKARKRERGNGAGSTSLRT